MHEHPSISTRKILKAAMEATNNTTGENGLVLLALSMESYQGFQYSLETSRLKRKELKHLLLPKQK